VTATLPPAGPKAGRTQSIRTAAGRATMEAGKTGSTRLDSSPVSRVRRAAKNWLDRPMTSWHLILAIFFLLLGFGLLMVLSASAIASFHHNDGSPFATFENQALFAGIGMLAFLCAARVSTKLLRTYSFPLVALSLMLLALVLLVSRRINGAKSWIDLGVIQFQPSEIAKLALLVWMGSVLAARRNTLRSIRVLLIPVLPIFVIMVALIMLEPDLGTTVSLGLVFIAVLWFAGAPWWMFAAITAGSGALLYYLATSAGYRNARVLSWLHPASAPPEAVWQINQSLYGLGHGGIFGAGLGESISKTGWLPNADSDFIFAIIGEELGLIGAGLVLVLFALLAYTGLRIARRNVDPFIKIVASAATVWLVGQATINICYVIGLLPVTGIPLPMISRGGTSLVVTMTVFGLLANFARREPQAAAALRSQGPGRTARFLGLGAGPAKPPKQPRVQPRRSGTATGPPAVRYAGERLPRRRTDRALAGIGNRTDGPAANRNRPPAPPVLRRGGDGLDGGLPVADWQGRSFVEPGTAHRVTATERGAGRTVIGSGGNGNVNRDRDRDRDRDRPNDRGAGRGGTTRR